MPTRLQERGFAPSPASSFGQICPIAMAEVRKIFREMVTEAKNQAVTMTEVPRHEIEPLRKHMLTMITEIGSKPSFLGEKLQEAGTTDADCVNQVRELQCDANSLLKLRTATSQETDNGFTRVAQRPSNLGEAIAKVQTQAISSENRPARRFSEKSSPKSKTSKKGKKTL